MTELLQRDAKGRIVRLAFVRAEGSVVSSIRFTYNALGNRTEVDYERLGVKASFGYNRVQWLTSEVWSPCRDAGAAPNLLAEADGNASDPTAHVTVVPQPPDTLPAHYQFYRYDEAGNRFELNGISRLSTYAYDEENRLVAETPGRLVKVADATAAASDTEPWFSPAVLHDGDTADSTDAARAWRSAASATAHSADLTWTTGARPLRQVRLYFPTGPGAGGPQKFKVQVQVDEGSGSGFVDARVLGAVSAQETSAGSGWFKAGNSCHEAIFAIEEVQTAGVRFDLLPVTAYSYRLRGQPLRMEIPGKNRRAGVCGAYRYPDGPFLFTYRL